MLVFKMVVTVAIVTMSYAPAPVNTVDMSTPTFSVSGSAGALG